MNKEKIKLIFHEKQMGLLEAKLYLCGLKIKCIKPNLNEKEIEDYWAWKEDKEEKNERMRGIIKEDIFKKLDERKYLIERLDRKIKLLKIEKKRLYCEKHGHKKSPPYIMPGMGDAVPHNICSRCGTLYKKD